MFDRRHGYAPSHTAFEIIRDPELTVSAQALASSTETAP